MAKPFGIASAKVILVIYNCPFVLAGAFLLASGLWLNLDKDVISYFKIMDKTPTGPLLDTVATSMMMVGGFVLLVGFLGCCGACCESMCLLCMYSLLLFLVIGAQIAGGIAFAILEAKFVEYMGKSMRDQVKFSYNRTFNTTDALTLAWDLMQVQLECCGAHGPLDYRNSYWFNQSQGQGNFVPATCCVLTNKDPWFPQIEEENQCQIDAILYPDDIVYSEAVKTRGCHRALLVWLKQHKDKFIAVAVTLGLLEVSGLILSCCLMACIRREQSKYPWYVDDDDD